ncbi:MAG: hypothetical protein GXO93_04735 [FCB group bacterium]|nr:hypothetical protein [FCB group bacterium]
MKRNSRWSLLILSLILLVALSVLFWVGCSDNQPIGSDNAAVFTPNPMATAKILPPNASEVAQVMAVQNRHASSLEAIKGVFGTATGRDNNGKVVILALADNPGVAGVPANLEGVPVKVFVTGRPELFAKPVSNKVDLKKRATRPVPTGYSIGNYNECASGTFGCAVEKGGNIYILSNNHVLARENAGSPGEPIVQPGRYDNKPICSGSLNDQIATLSEFIPVQTGSNANNTVDCAIAISSTADIGCATPSSFYGLPNSTPVDAVLDLPVKKVGRTSSETHGTIIGVNATVTIEYAGANTRFVDQVLISSRFSKAGDSGSLIVTDDANDNPVALLFAGNRQGYTWGNRIQNVLGALNVTICGK